MSNRYPWSSFYWDDWTTATAHLSHLEYSIYHRLLAHYYKSQRPLLANATGLLRLCSSASEAEQASLTSVLDQFFELRDDGYHNKRADAEIEKAIRITNHRAESGRIGGLAKARNLLKQESTHPHPQQHPQEKGQKLTPVQPTLEEVQEYCKTRQNSVDAQAWFDHYTSNGWKVGRVPMKDWRAAVRTWERNSQGRTNHGKPDRVQEQLDARNEAIRLGPLRLDH
jgi:uncharacterized protein YdaU (DUF1376 family)